MVKKGDNGSLEYTAKINASYLGVLMGDVYKDLPTDFREKIFAAVWPDIENQVRQAITESLPDIISKVGSEIALAGIKQLLNK